MASVRLPPNYRGDREIDRPLPLTVKGIILARQRVLNELKVYNAKLDDLQLQAGQAELSQWLVSMGPAYERYEEKLHEVGFTSLGAMLPPTCRGGHGLLGRFAWHRLRSGRLCCLPPPSDLPAYYTISPPTL